MKEILLTEKEMVFLVLLYFYDLNKNKIYLSIYLKIYLSKNLSI